MTRTDDLPVARTDGAPDVERRLRDAPGLFVAVDFDGTLAPIAEDPDEPTATPESRAALERLVDSRDAEVAVVSGRALHDLVDRVGVDGVTYVGNHGLERRREGDREVRLDINGYRWAIADVARRLRRELAPVIGASVEDKDLTVSVHYRRTPEPQAPQVASAVEAVVAAVDPDFRVVEGKQVFEIRPAVDCDKGSAVADLAAETPPEWTTVYVGDDTTDEDAFRAVTPEGVAVLVGRREESAATHRLDGQDDVAPFLTWVADALLETRPDPTSDTR